METTEHVLIGELELLEKTYREAKDSEEDIPEDTLKALLIGLRSSYNKRLVELEKRGYKQYRSIDGT